MDHDTKITYGVIAALIIILGGMAYFLQPTPSRSTKDTAQVTQQTPPQKSQLTTKATSTQVTNTHMEQKIFLIY